MKTFSASKFLYLEKQPKIFIKCCQILRLTPLLITLKKFACASSFIFKL
ncbi:hypothetical protein HMPREF1423_01322 [Helicobacter pylori GAM270ASi]|nr:hypothetical protein HMPREF1423_01322 [Helicobacter pylori GAM270ASi]